MSFLNGFLSAFNLFPPSKSYEDIKVDEQIEELYNHAVSLIIHDTHDLVESVLETQNIILRDPARPVKNKYTRRIV